MGLIDADKAKAELLAIAETIPAWPGFFDGIRSGYSYTLLYLLTGIAFVKKKPFCPKYGEMVYYVTVSGYIQEVRFDTDSTLHQLLRKAGKLYRSEEEVKRYLDKDYKDLIIQEEE